MTRAAQTNLVPQVINFVGSELDTKFAPYQRMANIIIHLTRKHGECLPDDLLPLGFSKEETRDRWHMAHAMAAIELRLMKAHQENVEPLYGTRS